MSKRPLLPQFIHPNADDSLREQSPSREDCPETQASMPKAPLILGFPSNNCGNSPCSPAKVLSKDTLNKSTPSAGSSTPSALARAPLPTFAARSVAKEASAEDTRFSPGATNEGPGNALEDSDAIPCLHCDSQPRAERPANEHAPSLSGPVPAPGNLQTMPDEVLVPQIYNRLRLLEEAQTQIDGESLTLSQHGRTAVIQSAYRLLEIFEDSCPVQSDAATEMLRTVLVELSHMLATPVARERPFSAVSSDMQSGSSRDSGPRTGKGNEDDGWVRQAESVTSPFFSPPSTTCGAERVVRMRSVSPLISTSAMLKAKIPVPASGSASYPSNAARRNAPIFGSASLTPGFVAESARGSGKSPRPWPEFGRTVESLPAFRGAAQDSFSFQPALQASRAGAAQDSFSFQPTLQTSRQLRKPYASYSPPRDRTLLTPSGDSVRTAGHTLYSLEEYLDGEPWQDCEDIAREDLIEWFADSLQPAAKSCASKEGDASFGSPSRHRNAQPLLQRANEEHVRELPSSFLRRDQPSRAAYEGARQKFLGEKHLELKNMHEEQVVPRFTWKDYEDMRSSIATASTKSSFGAPLSTDRSEVTRASGFSVSSANSHRTGECSVDAREICSREVAIPGCHSIHADHVVKSTQDWKNAVSARIPVAQSRQSRQDWKEIFNNRLERYSVGEPTSGSSWWPPLVSDSS